MRTKTLLLVAALSAAGLATSMAQSNVYSLNVVGYVNRTLNGNGQYTLLANPLQAATNTLDGIVASVAVPFMTVQKWNNATVSFSTYTRNAANSNWLPPGSGGTSLNPGEGFFVKNPSNDLTLTFVGEVLQGTLTVDFPAVNNLVGNKFPDTGLMTSMQFTNVPAGNRVLLWNETLQAYATYTKTTTSWLPPPGAGPSLGVAEGFFQQNLTNNGIWNGPSSWVRNATVQ